MIQALGNLSQEEQEEFLLVPIWISILIASADNKIDKHEIKKAVKLANEKAEAKDELIAAYYSAVARHFEVNMKGYTALLPQKKDLRVNFLTEKLSHVNYFFSKLELDFAHKLYLSFRDLAHQVAKATGGIFGLLSVSYAESKFIDLKMIDDPYQNKNE